jgi:hypothetical protein
MNGSEIVLAVGGGLAVNELCELSPWLARKLVGWAARRRHRANPTRGAIRAEELAAIIDARPGKLFKLLTALAFAAAAAGSIARDAAARMSSVRSVGGQVVRWVRDYQLVLLPLITAASATTASPDALSRPGQGTALICWIILSITASVAQLRHHRRQRATPTAGLETTTSPTAGLPATTPAHGRPLRRPGTEPSDPRPDQPS